MKVYFISLGCDKNLVDSEVMLGLLADNGHTITDDETEAEAELPWRTQTYSHNPDKACGRFSAWNQAAQAAEIVLHPKQ